MQTQQLALLILLASAGLLARGGGGRAAGPTTWQPRLPAAGKEAGLRGGALNLPLASAALGAGGGRLQHGRILAQVARPEPSPEDAAAAEAVEAVLEGAGDEGGVEEEGSCSPPAVHEEHNVFGCLTVHDACVDQG